MKLSFPVLATSLVASSALVTGTAWACETCGCRDTAAATATEAPTENIVEIAQSAGSFNTLVAALEAADLADVLTGEGPFTVLAPTDEAFAALPEGVLESLLLPENKEQLQAILLYHVVAANATSDIVATLDEVETVGGKVIDIEVDGDHIHLNGEDGAHVVATDVMATNGVIHVIDAVLLPPAE